MGWFSKRSRHETKLPQAREEKGLKTVFFNAVDMPMNPTRAHIEQLANSDDEPALRKAIAEMGDLRAGAPMWLAFPPITSAKVATLSLLIYDAQPDAGIIPGMNTANVAHLALWQLLLSGAKPDQLAILEQIASPEGSHANYDVAYGILSTLMTSSLGRDLKAGEMENVRRLIGSHLRLSPEQLLH
jgi:hypothetical protein